MTQKQVITIRPYTKKLTADQTAAAMQAANWNAKELLESAEILFENKRFPHSMAYSILAIEETGKLPILQSIYMGVGEQFSKQWKLYRQHKAKTETLNMAIYARIRAEFPNVSESESKAIAIDGPSPEQLENDKQKAIYSDCYSIDGEFVCHLPQKVNWERLAWERLCEARAVILSLRDKTPEELELFRTYFQDNKIRNRKLSEIFSDLEKELKDRGLIKEGWWDSFKEDLKLSEKMKNI